MWIVARFPGPHDSVCAARAQASAHLGSASRTQECFHTHKSASMGPRRARTTRATRTHERMSTSTCIVSAHAYGYARAHAGMTQAHVRCANVRPRCRRRRHDEAADSARVCAGKLQQRAVCGCTASDRRTVQPSRALGCAARRVREGSEELRQGQQERVTYRASTREAVAVAAQSASRQSRTRATTEIAARCGSRASTFSTAAGDL